MDQNYHSPEILFCPDCHVGVDALFSTASNCSHCGGPRIVLATHIVSIQPEVYRQLTNETMVEPVDLETPPLPSVAEDLIFRAQRQMIK